MKALLWLQLSTLLFAVTFLLAGWALFKGREGRSFATLSLMTLGFVGQCAFLGLRGQALGRCPITNPYEILVFVSWSAVLLYFLVGQAFRLSLMGVFTAPLVALFQGWALLHLSSETEYRPAEDYWLEMHASISLLAYGSFALAALAGVMFLLQNRLLRQGQIGSLSLSLPPVTNLSRSIPRIVGIGIILLTLGIASGFGMERPPTGIHLALSFSVWLLYLAFLALRFWGPLPNPRMAWCVIGAFLLPMLTLRFISH